MGFKLLQFCLCFSVVFVAFGEEITRYYGHKVLRLLPTTKAQIEYLHDLVDTNFELNFWTFPRALNETVDIQVPPHLLTSFNNELTERHISNFVLIEDAEVAFTKQREEVAELPRGSEINEAMPRFFTAYQRLAAILSLLTSINTANPSITALETIGTSTNGNLLRLIKIGVNVAANTKPIIFIDGGIHAREWISPATVTYVAQALINGYNNNNATIRTLLTNFDFYILPVSNPDGYEYTHTTTRLWRKTRSVNSGSTCVGTDPNRNFDYQWNTVGASTNPCSEIYAGSRAFSEPETKALSDYIYARRTRVKGYFNVHSYGQYWLYPWGYTSALPPHNAQLNAAATVAVNELTRYYSTRYTIGTSTNVLYAAAGGADDWAYGGAGVTYSYCVELRDGGTNGFTLPAAQITPSGIETSNAFYAIANHIGAQLKLF